MKKITKAVIDVRAMGYSLVKDSWSVTVEPVSNGAIVTIRSEGEADQREVFEFESGPGASGLEKAAHMLWAVADAVGLGGSKHDRERLEIKVVHGSNYVCTDKRCKICKGEL